jgi:hypothetical protein
MLRPVGHLIRKAMEDARMIVSAAKIANREMGMITAITDRQEMRVRTKKKLVGIISEAAERELRSKR